eukprot:scaffold7759_cov119-Isochrysis_galbana.AAC.7
MPRGGPYDRTDGLQQRNTAGEGWGRGGRGGTGLGAGLVLLQLALFGLCGGGVLVPVPLAVGRQRVRLGGLGAELHRGARRTVARRARAERGLTQAGAARRLPTGA